MRNRFLKVSALMFTFAALLFATEALAEGRYALVIGNGAYKVDPLKHAVNDAKSVKLRLQELGFEVVYRENLKADKIDQTVQQFRALLKPNSVALFYYAGHAMQIHGTNYLMSPFERKLTQLKAIPQLSINLNSVVAMMHDAGVGLSLVMVDASRRAPVTRNMHRGIHGLAKMVAPPATLISFAAGPGEYGSDDSRQQHSRYTSGLLEMLDDIDAPIQKAMDAFHGKQKENAQGRNIPWLAGHVDSGFAFNPKKETVFTKVEQSNKSAQPKLGDAFVEPFVDMSFVYIEKGSFLMGSPKTELHRYRDEKQHKVEIEKGFWMGIHEVTFDQFKLFYETTSNTEPLDNHWGQGKRPVIMINWYQACAYANWLSGQTGRHYRLPTEAEWEYAARAGTTTAFSFGDDENGFDDYAWNGENSAYKTQPVGLKKPNPWGIYDIHGNVWEWTSSFYSQEFDGSEKVDSSLEIGYEDRAARGGAWYFPAKGMRSADRRLYHPKQKVPYMGFRLILEE